MPVDNKDLLEQLDRHMESANQAWLLGAGISYQAGIPLMGPLTARVKELMDDATCREIVDAIFSELPEQCHIEHLLSHIGDYLALAERSKAKQVVINGKQFESKYLSQTHADAVKAIATVVRWGYKPACDGSDAVIGEAGAPKVTVKGHQSFIDALFTKARAGLGEQTPVRLFTTNYDTLIEDALALNGVTYWDGFTGGAIAFRNYHFGDDLPKGRYRTHLIKLHGSIDWHLCDGKVLRLRDSDLYPKRDGHVMIYPQSTKYVATQRDPFAAQFDIFRQTLASQADNNVLAVCGYSFGDEHINEEIEAAMSSPGNKTTMLIFYREGNQKAGCLSHWLAKDWGKRIYLVTEKGVYTGDEHPYNQPEPGSERDWWTFEGVTRMLTNGAEGSLHQ